MVKDIDLLIR